MKTGRSVEVKQSPKEEQKPSLRGLCEGRENRRLAPSDKAPDSVRGLARAQKLVQANEKDMDGG